MYRILFFILCAMLCSCSFFDEKTESVSLFIPELPEEFSPLVLKRYRIVIADKEGRKEFTISKDKRTITTNLAVSGVSAILVYPETDYTELHPAGIIINNNLSNKKSLSWEAGFAAEITVRILSDGYSGTNFNFTLFQKKLLAASEGNPWLLDQDKIIYAVEYEIFSSSYIKKREQHTLSLSFSGEQGIWYDNFLGKITSYQKDGDVISNLRISEGENIFINPVVGTSFTVFADKLSWICIFSNTTGGLCGIW